jgi:hypothetical protein
LIQRNQTVANSDTKPPSEHYDELLLPYVEDALAPEERRIVQDHVDHCPRCSGEVKGLRAIIAALGEHKRAFCPEAWEIYECVRSGGSPHGALSLHLKECPRCLEEFQSYAAPTTTEPMPAELLAKVKERLEQSPGLEMTERVQKRSFVFWDWIPERFRRPALGIAAAVAAMLVVVLIYPREPMGTVVGLSTVAWENAPRPKTGLESPGKRSAVLIFFKNFKEPLSRDKVDSLYQALEPPIEVNEKFDVISPADLSKAIRRGVVDSSNRKKLLEDLDKNLAVSKVVMITVEPETPGFDVKCDLIRTSDGIRVKKRIVRGVTEAELASKVRGTVWELLLGSKGK